MPSLQSQLLTNQSDYEKRMANELRTLAMLISTIVNQFARERNATGDLVVPNTPTTTNALRMAVWEQAVRRYFGSQDTQLDGIKPLNPFMVLIRDGVYSATRIAVEYQVNIIQENASPDVYRFLTGQRAPQVIESKSTITISEIGVTGLRRLAYDPWHLFVDPNGYILSERGWVTSQEARNAIDALLTQQIPLGTSAVNIADMLERYLYPEAANIRTRTPYGYDGSFWARRLARTEITAAGGRATYNAALLNPFVDEMDWRLSGSHPKPDICDDYAAGSPYRLEDVPGHPAHPHCVTPGQLVETLHGMKLIENIKSGDMVRTHKGRFQEVSLSWSRPYSGDVYQIKTIVGDIEITSEHPVLTQRGWVNAEELNASDYVVYTGLDIGVNLGIGITESMPTLFGKTPISNNIPLSVMPVDTITFDSDFDFRNSKVDSIRINWILLNERNIMVDKGIPHFDFDTSGSTVTERTLPRATKVLFGMGTLDTERFSAMPTYLDDTVSDMAFPINAAESVNAGIVNFLYFRNLLTDFRSLGGVVLACQIDVPVNIEKCLTSNSASRPIVLFPSQPNALANVTHIQIAKMHEFTEHAKCNLEFVSDGNTTHILNKVHIVQNIADGCVGLLFYPEDMPFYDADVMTLSVCAAGRFEKPIANGASEIEGHYNNLLSLSPDNQNGHGSGNPFVSEEISPTQAQTYYIPIREINKAHYEGLVYNMEVNEDNSYTVNNIAVHNCLCSLLPRVARNRAEINNTIQQMIFADYDTPYIINGQSYTRRNLQGMFNLDFLLGILLTVGITRYLND